MEEAEKARCPQVGNHMTGQDRPQELSLWSRIVRRYESPTMVEDRVFKLKGGRGYEVGRGLNK
jgi:hypothetical protein